MLSATWHASPRRFELLLEALEKVTVDGVVLEFGVSHGTTLGLIADHTELPVHGFDSFHGLPEQWRGLIPAGEWSTGGVPPETPPHVEIHTGPFSETLPDFAARNRLPIAFMHVDCDLYSSTKTVFEHLVDLIVPGTIVVFDQFMNFPDSEKYEYRAFHEFVEEYGIRYEYVRKSEPGGFSVSLRILPAR